MKVLFLGGTSYLGKELIKHLEGLGGFEISTVLRTTTLEEVSKLPLQDIVFNLVVDYGKNCKPLVEVMTANVTYPLSILEKISFKTIFNFSTGLDKSVSHYSFSKKILEETLTYLGLQRDFQVINLQLQHFFGPGAPDHNFITFLISKMLRNEEIPLTDCEQRRDFLFTPDLIDAIKLLIQKKGNLGKNETIQIGSGNAWVLKDIIKMIKDISGSKSVLKFGEIAKRQNEPSELKADISKMAMLGWKPKTEITSAIKITVQASK